MTLSASGAAPRGAEPGDPLPADRRWRALSVEAPLLERVRGQGVHGRVHSVFERAVNVLEGDGGLFTLAARGLDNAPDTVVVDVDHFDGGVAAGDAVLAAGGRLWCESGLCVVFDATRPWDCVLPAYPDATGRLRANLDWCMQRLDEHRGAASERLSTFDAAALQLLAQRSERLEQALARRNVALAALHARSMLGLGPGLTPSGDDVLVGLFAVLHLPGSPCERWLGGGAPVLQGARRATTAISLAALQCAAQGRVRESLAELLVQLLDGQGPALEAALDRVLRIGSHSGADMVSGIACGLRLNLIHGMEPS